MQRFYFTSNLNPADVWWILFLYSFPTPGFDWWWLHVPLKPKLVEQRCASCWSDSCLGQSYDKAIPTGTAPSLRPSCAIYTFHLGFSVAFHCCLNNWFTIQKSLLISALPYALGRKPLIFGQRLGIAVNQGTLGGQRCKDAPSWHGWSQLKHMKWGCLHQEF